MMTCDDVSQVARVLSIWKFVNYKKCWNMPEQRAEWKMTCAKSHCLLFAFTLVERSSYDPWSQMNHMAFLKAFSIIPTFLHDFLIYIIYIFYTKKKVP